MTIKKVMKTVQMFLLTVFIGTSLVACKEPDITVTSLSAGKSLPAPILLSNGLVNEFPDNQKFLRFTGSCHSRVSGFEIAYLRSSPIGLSNYNLIPSSTNYDSNNDLTIDTTLANDLNCSDGSFDFVISIDMLLSHLGFSNTTELENSNIDALYIRGLAGNEVTLPLILATSGGGGDSQTPRFLVIETENFHRVVPASLACAQLNLTILSDEYYTINTNNINGGSYQIELSNSSASGPYSSIPVFSNYGDCVNNVNSIASQSINSSGQGMSVYINVSSANGLFYLRTANTSVTYSTVSYGLVNESPRAIYKVRASEEIDSRFLSLTNFPRHILNDRCYALDLNYLVSDPTLMPFEVEAELAALRISFSIWNGSGDLTSTRPFALYTNSTCSDLLNASSLPWFNNTARIYLRYNSPAGIEDYDFARIRISAPIGPSGRAVYPASQFVFTEPGIGTTPTIALIHDQFSNSIASGICQNMQLEVLSNNEVPITLTSPFTVTLSANLPGQIMFYSNPDCSGSGFALNQLDIDFFPATFRKPVSYRVINDTNTSFNLITQIGMNAPISFNRNAQPAIIDSMTLSNFPSMVYSGICSRLNVVPVLRGGVMPAMPRNFNFVGSGISFYTDPGCSAGNLISAPILLMPTGVQYQVYFRTAASGPFFITAQSLAESLFANLSITAFP